MARLNTITKDTANGQAKSLLEAVEKKLGKVPNMMGAMANSPAVLEAYLNFSGALAKGSLTAKVREQIALAVGERNDCQYCLAAHSTLGKLAGLSGDEIADSRRGASPDERTQAILSFAKKLVSEQGRVDESDVRQLRDAGLNDGGIAEVIANVAVNLFTNYFNHAVDTVIDFPKAEPIEACGVCAG
ncbi:MAG: peroxidase-related enzyme [Phycisphaerales bacterium]|nr:peroxidase-related enzyme [Phycisphaerales bacterium]MCB9857063.1 peroxidase-related enzyme [Phycisphaerales bacterium]MCB9861810.1 peroxidase-related enzyme [Phycisphaerales bacterium]